MRNQSSENQGSVAQIYWGYISRPLDHDLCNRTNLLDKPNFKSVFENLHSHQKSR
jgi:hypothetical protein